LQNFISVTETKTAIVNLIDEAVLRIEFKQDSYITVPDFEENLLAYHKEMRTEKVYLLTVANSGVEPSPEVRALFSSKLRSEFKMAEAFVISSFAQRILANFVMKVQPPNHPLKFFNSETEAKEWLYEQRKKIGRAKKAA
jgi:hypothetical protein